MKKLLLAAVVACACGPAKPVDTDPLPFEAASLTASPDPTKPGPYPVGVRTVTYEDTGRRKPDGSPRILVTEIWYPATQDTRGKEGVSYDITTLLTDSQRANLGNAIVPILKTDAVRDAPIAKTHGPFPLIMFGHGQGAVRFQSTYLTVLLASHGYIVVAPDHEGGTLYDALRDQLQNVAIGVETRPQDLLYLINRMGRLPEGDPLTGMIDFDKIGMTGHSFGGLASLRAAAMDKRIKAIVPQSPPNADICWLGLPQPVKLDIPVMLQSGGLDKTLKFDQHITPTWPLLSKPRYMLKINKGGHFTFSDLCGFDLVRIASSIKIEIPGANLDNVLNDGCGTEAPVASVAQPIINNYAIGFFNVYLRGSEGTKARLNQAAADALTPGVSEFTADP